MTKEEVQLHLDGQLDKHWRSVPWASPNAFLWNICHVFLQSTISRQNQIHSIQLCSKSAPEPRVQILVLTFASHMGGTGSFTPSPAPHSLLKVPVTLSLWGEAKAKDPQWKAWNDKLFRSLGGKWNNPRLMFNSCTLCRRIYWLLLCWTSRCRAKKFITCSPRSRSVMNIWEFPIRSRGGRPPVDSQPHQLLRVWD